MTTTTARHAAARALCVGLLALLVPCAVAAATGVTYVTQRRAVVAMLEEKFDDLGPVRKSGRETANAADFAPFDASPRALLPAPDAVRGGFGAASQQSRLDPLGVFSNGSFSGEVSTTDGGYSFDNLIDVTFDVPELLAYNLAYRLDLPTPFTDIRQSRIRLTGPGDAIVFDPLVEYQFDELRDTIAAEATLRGLLQPGRYHFNFDHAALATVAGTGGHTLSLTFAPVPDPSTATAGLLLAYAGLLRRRRGR